MPFLLADIVCPHNLLTPAATKRKNVPVEVMISYVLFFSHFHQVWSYFQSKSSENPVGFLASEKSCPKCLEQKREQDQLNKIAAERRISERKELDGLRYLKENRLTIGPNRRLNNVTYYVIPQNWIQSWWDYVLKDG